ncbi:MAG: nicotinate-nucleotide adenylyltransferase [Alphaproteobacteria bacterium]|nr:nicotinate-nucleotide adenylyltransferase [Alphaproteobacteria bacterium]
MRRAAAAGARQRRGPRVGLLGGSFNPAHSGHLHISRLALHRLALDQVWWLVSPQNPLKPVAGMRSLGERVAVARALATAPRIVVTDLEMRLGTRRTLDTLRAIRRRFPRHRFVWIMGADNLVQMPRWHRWRAIFAEVPIAVFDRPAHSFTALAGPAASVFRHARLRQERATTLAWRRPPAWTFLWAAVDPASATAIRSAGGLDSPAAARKVRGVGQLRQEFGH